MGRRIDGLETAETIPKKIKDTSKAEVERMRMRLPEEYLVEIFQNHFMFYMLGIVRGVGKNEFKINSGELMTVDLDRATWSLSDGYSSRSDPTDFTVCYICKIKEKTYEQIERVTEMDGLVTTLRHSLYHDLSHLQISRSEQDAIETRLGWFMERCILPCLSKYGNKDVIIE